MIKRPKGAKYGAVKVFKHGRKWPSKLELAVYEMLLLMERGGKLKDIKCQVTVRFHTHHYGYTTMIPDFKAFDIPANREIFIEAKGFKTREYIRKEKAWAMNGPAPLYVYEGNWRYPKLAKIIEPKGEASA